MKYNNRILFLLFFCIIFSSNLYPQKKFAIKNNLPHSITLTPNIGIEIAFKHKMTFELSGGYNPFEYSDSKSWKHWIIWPETRYWLYETFSGHFFGLHGVFSEFDIGGIDMPIEKLSELKYRHIKGGINGLGISYGYAWIISNNLTFEFTVGAGYGRLNYGVYTTGKNRYKINDGKKHYIGPTKGAISFVYVLP